MKALNLTVTLYNTQLQHILYCASEFVEEDEIRWESSRTNV